MQQNALAKMVFINARFWICLLSLFISAPVCSEEETVKEFMSFYFNTYRSGLPDEGQIEKLQLIITPELHRLLADARRAEDCHQARVHNEEPPLWEGDLFTSLFEGATSGKIAAVSETGTSAVVDVEWTYKGDRQEQVVWHDNLYLVSRGGIWLLDDIEHRAGWEFSYRGRISGLLHDIADECSTGDR